MTMPVWTGWLPMEGTPAMPVPPAFRGKTVAASLAPPVSLSAQRQALMQKNHCVLFVSKLNGRQNMATQPNHYPNLPANLPWHTSQAILLLDGVSIENLLAKIYRKASQNKIECLYINTRWEGLKDISPSAILLTSDQGPLLKDYLAQLNEETGYLFFSKAPWQQIITHLRWLIEITEPTQQSLMLRFAEPAVMVALLKTKKMILSKS